MRSSEKARKRVFCNNCTFCVEKNVYEPAEDTFLLAENLVVDERDVVLDMGTGCGILGILAAKRARKVVAVDVNPHAVRCAEMNARLNGVMGKMDIRRGDLFKPIRKDEKFDIIVFNAPYLPSKVGEEKTWIGRAWAGGPHGRRLIDRFICGVPNYLKEDGTILLVQSTLSNVDETLRRLDGEGLRASILAEKKVAFETIVLIKAERR